MKAPPPTRLKITVRGAVQGVGFRPFVFRLASELGLRGWVNNSSQGVFIEAEGGPPALQQFLLRLETEKPPLSSIQSMETSWLDPVGFKRFEIRESEPAGDKTAIVLPDIATCTDCLREIFDPNNRRYHYPFTNCTHCGPRFSIIESLPYDRRNTSMKVFQMCAKCQAEYEDPKDRRFHAQPNACPDCGPRLELWDRSRACEGAEDAPRKPCAHKCGGDALLAAANAIREGKIVAIKGLGGFHLMVDARNDAAIRSLRARKRREEKPFAVMAPSLDAVKKECEVSRLEARLLRSPESPIVLLKKIVNGTSQIANSTAPDNPNLGVMLPYTPLHHLLMRELDFPIVATSGNLSDEPICTDEQDAWARLNDIADVFLVHDRPIVRHVDDSIVRVMLDREMVLRRARGYAPLPVHLRSVECGLRNKVHEGSGTTGVPNSELRVPKSILAVGAHLKNSVALSTGAQVFISQHIGDLETEQAYNAFRHAIEDFETLYGVRPEVIAADLHPDYLSTKYAGELEEADSRSIAPDAKAQRPARIGVQHHIAHVLSCMAENQIAPPVLGVSWDGTGYGTDGSIWGGEFFVVTDRRIVRAAHLRPFRLPGGEQAVKEPRRAALGLLYEMFGGSMVTCKNIASVFAFSGTELTAIGAMLMKKLNAPVTTSMGRLFDAVASLTGLRQMTRFEGQAAMELESAINGVETDEAYPMAISDSRREAACVDPGKAGQAAGAASVSNSELRTPNPALMVDWAPLVEGILADVKTGLPISTISAKFHNALAEAIVRIAQHEAQSRVVLSGGCFQNRYLTERAVRRLQATGFKVYWHQRVPPNDGGVSLGQVVAALRVIC